MQTGQIDGYVFTLSGHSADDLGNIHRGHRDGLDDIAMLDLLGESDPWAA